MKAITLILSALLLIGCATQQKKEDKRRKQAKEFFLINPKELAEICNETFPILDFEYLPGNYIETIDTIVNYVQIECPEPTLENPTPKVNCPESKTIFKEKVRIDTVKIVDTRTIYLRNEEIKTQKELISKQDELIKILEKEKNSENKSKIRYMWISGVLLGLILIYVAFKFYKKMYLK